jgi:hypothetical protein
MINDTENSKLINTEIYIKKNKCIDCINFLVIFFIVINLILNSIILYSVIELSNNAQILFNSSLVTDVDKINNIINFVCNNILQNKC